jgi:uncharacterized membrane protein
MPPYLRELLELLARWVHLIAGIMWIGNSLLFNWLDRNLVPPSQPRDPQAKRAGRLLGEIWMVHSGGFYQVEKKFLAPSELPAVLHWFKWQSYTTWMSGMALLVLIYYMGGSAFLVDSRPGAVTLSAASAVAFGLVFIFGGLFLYDGLWRLIGPHEPEGATLLSLVLCCAAVFVATRVLGGRAAYIHVGVLLGTIMSGNVFLHIIPSQRQLVAATAAGRPQDEALSMRAKQRSIHNNYLTFPLLFIMISNHFAGTYGHHHSGWVLLLFMVSGALVRHLLNIRFGYPQWKLALAAVLLFSVGMMAFVLRPPSRTATAGGERPAFSAIEPIIAQRCRPCHSQRPTDPQWQLAPNAVMFDSQAQIRAYAERIRVRAVLTRTMPLGNKTGMTDSERELLDSWLSSLSPSAKEE